MLAGALKPKGWTDVRRAAVSFLACALIGAGLMLAAPQAAYAAEDNGQDTNDPFEEVNRVFFEIHNGIDKLVLIPAARVYRAVIPAPGRQSIRNFLRNLNSPVIFANDILQGEPNRAGTTLARFGINSTIGVAGLFDPATSMGFERHTEDFGQTLGVHGVSEGPYIFLPLFGPSPPRDLVGRVADTAMDPITWIGGDDFQYFKYGRVALRVLDLREQNLETLDEIERTSVDYYAAVRSLYRQSRNGAIRNGEFDFEDLPDLGDDFEDDF
jgi:phospholipid-binding lipoprotein MlaA